MSGEFVKVNLAEARNADGAVVRSVGRELMQYHRGDYQTYVEIFFRGNKAVAYEPKLPEPLPTGMISDAIRAEIKMGVEVNAECPVEWRVP